MLPNSIEDVFGVKGQLSGGVYQVAIGRTTTMHGYEVGNAMGVNTWAALAGSNEKAMVDGDFVRHKCELQPVLKNASRRRHLLRCDSPPHGGGNPSTVFLHYWGVGPTRTLATGLKAALETYRP